MGKLTFKLTYYEPLAVLIWYLISSERLLRSDKKGENDYRDNELTRVCTLIVNKEPDVLNKAIKSVSDGTIPSNYLRRKSYCEFLGAPPYPVDRDILGIGVDAISFFDWATENGHEIGPDIKLHCEVNRLKYRVERYSIHTVNRKHVFKALRDPLWKLDKAILYLHGYDTSETPKENAEIVDTDESMSKTAELAQDSSAIGKLDIIKGDGCIKVRPKEFMRWAATLGMDFPNLITEGMLESKAQDSPEYQTDDMRLMYDAVEHFWIDYDLSNPDTGKAPFKKDVVSWLLDEAKKRNIDMSKTRAETMDTIMRCPVARRGGNTT